MLETEAGTWRELVGVLADGLLRDSGACGSRELGGRELVGRPPSSSVVFGPSVSAPQAGRCARRRLAGDLRAQTVTGLGRVTVLLLLDSIVQIETILGRGRRGRSGYRCRRRRGDGVCAWMQQSMSCHFVCPSALQCHLVQCNASHTFHVDLRATANRSSAAALLPWPRNNVVNASCVCTAGKCCLSDAVRATRRRATIKNVYASTNERSIRYCSKERQEPSNPKTQTHRAH